MYKKYYSPIHAIEGLLKFIHPEGVIFEPCVGKGAISNYLIERGLRVITNDLDPRVNADYHFDARFDNNSWPQSDWIITNPPYGDDSESMILENALKYSKVGVAMLLLISFKEGTRYRKPIHLKHPPNIEIITPRYSFDGRGKYTQTTSWFVWIHGMKEQSFHWI
jgi:hypothetical protein